MGEEHGGTRDFPAAHRPDRGQRAHPPATSSAIRIPTPAAGFAAPPVRAMMRWLALQRRRAVADARKDDFHDDHRRPSHLAPFWPRSGTRQAGHHAWRGYLAVG